MRADHADRARGAISEDDRLVCFYVYGEQREALEPAFRQFDRAFAARLGLPLYGRRDWPPRQEGDRYAIASILSHRWWDDTAWTEA